jgi:hypothetical protein
MSQFPKLLTQLEVAKNIALLDLYGRAAPKGPKADIRAGKACPDR